jgi:two-component system response regulator YesN
VTVRILIADDEELERRALALIIGSMPELAAETVEAANGEEAVAAARAAEPDLALLDVRMPGMDGLAAARALRSLYPGLRIVFVTAFDSFEYAREALRLGVDEYLVKPAEPEAVRAVVRGALAKLDESRRALAERSGALALLEREIRVALERGALAGDSFAEFARLRGLDPAERWALALRPVAEPAGGGEDGGGLRTARLRRAAVFAEGRLRAAGWPALAAFDGSTVRIAAARCAAPPAGAPPPEPLAAAVDRLAVAFRAELGLPVLIGLAPVDDAGADACATAFDALALARPARAVVALAPAEAAADEAPEGGAASGAVARALDLLRARLADDLTLTDVAAAVQCSPFYLSRLFSRQLGATFVRTLGRLRVEAAQALLRTGRYSVKEAGALVGFRDPDYFGRVFRREVGRGPAEFRADPDGSGRAK